MKAQPDIPNPRPMAADSRPWMDLRAASVKVRRGLLCLTLRTAAVLPDDGSYVFNLVVLGRDSRGRALPPARLTLRTRSATWYAPGAVQDLEADALEHAYRREANTISAAVRTDGPFPHGLPNDVQFDSFRWRIDSLGKPPRAGRPESLQVDCAPERTWIHYPTGRRTLITDSVRTRDVKEHCEPGVLG